MAYTILTLRTEIDGEIQPVSRATIEEYNRLGGKTVAQTVKTVDLRFPTESAAAEFRKFATRTDRATFA